MARSTEPRALVGNAADPEQVADAAKQEKLAMHNSDASWRAVLSTPEGRTVLWELMGLTGMHSTITVTSSEIYVRSGRRDVGLDIQRRILQLDEAFYLQMQKESYDAARKVVTAKPKTEDSDHG
jgi:hypothetical protein